MAAALAHIGNNETLDPYNAVIQVLRGLGRDVTSRTEYFTTLRRNVSSYYQARVISPRADYSQLDYQCAYIFIYFPFHAISFTGILRELSSLFKRAPEESSRKELNVCSIGGGPGTDFFGLATVAQKLSFPRMSGTILERYPQWEEMFTAFKEASPSFSNYVDDIIYINYDFHDLMTDEVRNQISKADLVTMVKFLSEVYDGNDDQFLQQLMLVLNSMKQGSFLVVIENSEGPYNHLLLSAVAECSMHLINGYPDIEFQVPGKYSIHGINTMFPGWNTMLNGNILIGIWKKI